MIVRLVPILMALRRELWKIRRSDRGRAFVLMTALLGVVHLIVAWIAVAAMIAMVVAGAPIVALVLGGLTGWLVLPHWMIEHVAIARGWHRVAWTFARWDPRGDRERWPWLCAARAAAVRGAPAAAQTWLFARAHRLDGTQLAAHGILAHGRGDRADARALLRSLADVADPAPEARELAGEWLALDAAERGAWGEVLDAARALAYPGRGRHRAPAAIDHARRATAATGEPLWPATPLAFLLEGVAARLLDRADAPSQLGLWARWLLAPRKRATLALVRAALAPAAVHPVVASTPAPATAVDAHARALADHRPASVAATVAAWSAVVDAPGWPAAQVERARALGVAPELAIAAAAAVRDQLVASLVDLAVAARASELDGSPLAAAVAARARARILDGLELSLARAHDRIRAHEALAPLDEWRAFLALRAAYLDAAAAGGLSLERVAYPHVDEAFGAWAVWMWNVRGEHVASHAISAWLFERALVVGDAAAIELHGKNGALAIPGV